MLVPDLSMIRYQPAGRATAWVVASISSGGTTTLRSRQGRSKRRQVKTGKVTTICAPFWVSDDPTQSAFQGIDLAFYAACTGVEVCFKFSPDFSDPPSRTCVLYLGCRARQTN